MFYDATQKAQRQTNEARQPLRGNISELNRLTHICITLRQKDIEAATENENGIGIGIGIVIGNGNGNGLRTRSRCLA